MDTNLTQTQFYVNSGTSLTDQNIVITDSATLEYNKEVQDIDVVENNNDVIEDTVDDVIDDTVEDNIEDTTDDTVENDLDFAKKEDAQQYAEELTKLTSTIEQLQNSLNEANITIDSLNNEIKDLLTFKQSVDRKEKENLFNTFKAKNVIADSDLDNLFNEIDNYDYNTFNLQLCKLYAESVINKDNTNTQIPVVNYTLQEPENTWEAAVAQTKNNKK